MRFKILCFGLVFVGLLAACGGDSGAGSEVTDTTEPVAPVVESTTSSTLLSEAVRPVLELENPEIPIEAYRQFVQHYRIAQGPPVADPDYEPLKELVTEEFYPQIRERIQEVFVDDGIVRVPPEDHILELTSVDDLAVVLNTEGNQHLMRVCFKENTELRTLTGELVTDETFIRGEDTYMLFRDGRWRVAFIDGFGREDKETAECEKVYSDQ